MCLCPLECLVLAPAYVLNVMKERAVFQKGRKGGAGVLTTNLGSTRSPSTINIQQLLMHAPNTPIRTAHWSLTYPLTQRTHPPLHLVCIAVLDKIDAGMDAKAKKNKLAVEEAIEAYCSKKDLENKEKKLCYFLKPIKRDVSQPFSTGMPKAKVCDRLKKKSAEICTIKYRK